MVAKKKKSAVASMLPDDMASAGLPDDFDGEITQVRVVPWDYEGNRDENSLAIRVTVTPDEESELDEFSQHYSCGELQYFVPSMDGETPVMDDLETIDLQELDEDEKEEVEGVFALQVGRREALNNNTNWAHFLQAAIDAGFPVDQVDTDVRFLEGTAGHFNRVPQKKRSGLVIEEEGSRRREILVLTEVVSTGGAATKSKSRSKTKTKSKAKTKSKSKASAKTENNGIDEELAAVVLEAIANAGGEIPKSKLPSIVMKAFEGSQRAAAVKRVANVEFLGSSEDWEFDADEATLSLG